MYYIPEIFKDAITVIPRGTHFHSSAVLGHCAASWESKLGYIAATNLGLSGLAFGFSMDGLNEVGLQASSTEFPSDYMKKPADCRNSSTLDHLQVTDFILGNCASVADVRDILPSMIVTDTTSVSVAFGGMHWSVVDTSGDSLVIEFVSGKLQLHNNTVGVMTNEPAYPWQVANLNQYVNLLRDEKPPRPLQPFQGSGAEHSPSFDVGWNLVGLPGDFTGGSRFVQLAILKERAMRSPRKPHTAAEGVSLAQQLLNFAFMPRGVYMRTHAEFDKRDEFTIYDAVFDLTNRRFLKRNALRGHQWVVADLNKLDLSTGRGVYELDTTTDVAEIDVTSRIRPEGPIRVGV